MGRSWRSDFDHVDQTTDPADFIRYLDATRTTPFFQEIKRRSFALLDLHAGDSVCDVGCGPGDDVVALSQLVAPGGRVLGVDASATMVAEAQARAATAGSAAEFVQMDAQHLDLPDASFEGVRAERLLQHLADPEAALREMVRIMKPEGRLVVWEADLDLFVIDAPDDATSRVMQRAICESFHNGAMGHELRRRFKHLGLAEVSSLPLIREYTDWALVESAFDLTAATHRAVETGLLTPQRATDWLASLAAARDAESFSCAVGGYLACGRKPR
jgi:ubiquinone/menaquinone biosynthesis C-methylase UbiE